MHSDAQGETGHFLSLDPGEAVDRLEGRGIHARRLRDLSQTLRGAIETNKTLAATFGEAEWTNADRRHREELNAIGYL